MQHPYQGYPWMGPGGETPCEVCGALPAAYAVVRGHQGIVVLMRFLKREGVFCRSCGTAIQRRMTSDTLWQGWWGPLSFFFTPITVLMNLGPRALFRGLPEPRGGWRPPLDPGRRVLLRPPALVILAPMVLLVLALAFFITVGVIVGDDSDSSGESGKASIGVGDCVRNLSTWPEQNLQRVDCDSSQAQYRTARVEDCTGDEYLMRLEDSVDAVAMCLRPLGNG
ncbi:hypothetical protein U9R90_04215 [Streptomyces sp. E11-3]|uniref:LppU/SCO3897 family protein n=1 Tax=Streptomyces sp. E11-3 TaxID=3110112 RepID=UPI00397F9693